jgi:spore photoproduct lyase
MPMDEILYFPQKVFVTKDSENLPLTLKILENTQHLPVEFITDSKELIEEVLISRDPLEEGKKLLLVTHQKGRFVKPCPCTPKYIGCNYFIINTELNCPIDCSYCILQLYLNNPLITVHANTSILYRQMDDFLHKNRHRAFRIGTGELGDSLALDHLTNRSTELISYFATRPNAVLELKTKTVNIKNILEHIPSENIVIAWSLNAHKIARKEEIGAPSVTDRIQAACLVSQAGYRVGFHFDPLIHYDGWEDGYAEVIDGLLTRIDREKIAWISLGSLRFPPALKSVIQKRFPQTKIIYDEFITGKDGKLRYPKPLRLRLFKQVVDRLKKDGAGKISVYFCMESGDVWKAVQKKAPRSKKEVEKLLTLPLGAKGF